MRILLVEDEDLLAEYLRLSLTKSGYDVDYAADGLMATEKLHTKPYDVVVLDIILPKKSGIEVCKDARLIGIQTPILILSSQDSEASRITGLDVGADDYMVKPFSYPELEARLRALYRRPKEIISDTITVGDVTFSSQMHRIWKGGHEVTLRAKEFALLEFMLRNINRVISREEIFQNVWGVQSINASNRVDACVKEIRNKLGKDIIRTLHGTGYAVEPIHGQE